MRLTRVCGRARPSGARACRPSAHPRATAPRRRFLRSALDDVDGEAAARGLLVLDLHVGAGLAHRLDHLVQADDVLGRRRASAMRAALIAFTAAIALRSMHGICTRPPTGSQVRPRLCSMPISAAFSTCSGRAAEHLAQRAGRHRAGRADLALAADLGAGDRRVLLVQHADRAGGEQEAHDAVVGRARARSGCSSAAPRA